MFIQSLPSSQLPPILSPSVPTHKKIRIVVGKGLSSVENGWNYVGKSIQLSRHVLNGVIKGCGWFVKRCTCETNARLSDAVRRLKLFTIISIPINLKQIPGLAGRVKQNFLWRDPKETILSSLSLSVLLMDTVDTVATFTSAALQSLSVSVPSLISAVGMPLSFGMLSLGVLNRTVRIWDMTKFLKETRKLKITDSPEEVKSSIGQYIQKHLSGNTSSSDQKHAESIIEKKSNGRALEEMKRLQILIQKEEFSKEDIRDATQLIANISRHIKHERKIHGAYLTANVVSLTALSFFSLSIGTVAPYALLAASVVIRFSTQVYQDKKR